MTHGISSRDPNSLNQQVQGQGQGSSGTQVQRDALAEQLEEEGVLKELFQNDTLSQAAKTRVKILAEFLMPELPPGSTQKLVDWLKQLVTTDTHDSTIGTNTNKTLADTEADDLKDAISFFNLADKSMDETGGSTQASTASGAADTKEVKDQMLSATKGTGKGTGFDPAMQQKVDLATSGINKAISDLTAAISKETTPSELKALIDKALAQMGKSIGGFTGSLTGFDLKIAISPQGLSDKAQALMATLGKALQDFAKAVKPGDTFDANSALIKTLSQNAGTAFTALAKELGTKPPPTPTPDYIPTAPLTLQDKETAATSGIDKAVTDFVGSITSNTSADDLADFVTQAKAQISQQVATFTSSLLSSELGIEISPKGLSDKAKALTDKLNQALDAFVATMKPGDTFDANSPAVKTLLQTMNAAYQALADELTTTPPPTPTPDYIPPTPLTLQDKEAAATTGIDKAVTDFVGLIKPDTKAADLTKLVTQAKAQISQQVATFTSSLLSSELGIEISPKGLSDKAKALTDKLNQALDAFVATMKPGDTFDANSPAVKTLLQTMNAAYQALADELTTTPPPMPTPDYTPPTPLTLQDKEAAATTGIDKAVTDFVGLIKPDTKAADLTKLVTQAKAQISQQVATFTSSLLSSELGIWISPKGLSDISKKLSALLGKALDEFVATIKPGDTVDANSSQVTTLLQTMNAAYKQVADDLTTTPPPATVTTPATKPSARVAPLSSINFTSDAFVEKAPKSNPYLQPGFMAILGAILAEIQKYVNKSVLESAQMQSKFIAAINQNAIAGANATLAGGFLQGQQNELDAQKYRNDSICAFTQGVSGAVITLASYKLQANAEDNVDRDRFKLIGANNQPIPAQTDSTLAGYDPPSSTTVAKAPGDPTYKIDTAAYSKAQLKAGEQVSTYTSAANQFVQKMTEGAQSAAAAHVTSQKTDLITSKAAADALSQILNQFISALQNAMQTVEVGKSATEFWHQILELAKSYAQTSGALWQKG